MPACEAYAKIFDFICKGWDGCKVAGRAFRTWAFPGHRLIHYHQRCSGHPVGWTIDGRVPVPSLSKQITVASWLLLLALRFLRLSQLCVLSSNCSRLWRLARDIMYRARCCLVASLLKRKSSAWSVEWNLVGPIRSWLLVCTHLKLNHSVVPWPRNVRHTRSEFFSEVSEPHDFGIRFSTNVVGGKHFHQVYYHLRIRFECFFFLVFMQWFGFQNDLWAHHEGGVLLND